MINSTKQSLEEVINDFNLEIDKNPGLADAYCSRGMVRLCLNDTPGAFMDWITAVDLGCKEALLLLRYFANPAMKISADSHT
jgi:hypothetical protein